MTSPESEGRFNKAITDLQADFKILPVGVTDAWAWHYAFSYAITAYHDPELSEQAQGISERQAFDQLTRAYLRMVGAARVGDLVKLFGWRQPAAEAALARLEQAGELRRGYRMEGQRGEYFFWDAHLMTISLTFMRHGGALPT
jgi:hypothetical protein